LASIELNIGKRELYVKSKKAIEDYGFKSRMLYENVCLRILGRKIAWGLPKIIPTGRCSGQDFLDSCPKDRRVLLIIDGISLPYPTISKAIPSDPPTDFRP